MGEDAGKPGGEGAKDAARRDDAMMPGDEGIYELEPAEPPRVASGSGPGKVGGEGLLEGFDEDADFEKDPEVAAAERAARGAGAKIEKKAARRRAGVGSTEAAEAPAEDASAIARAGGIPARVLAIAGGIGVVATGVVAGVFAEKNAFAVGLAASYMTLVMGGLGVAAVAIAASLLGRPMGRVDLVGARMLFASALFGVLACLRLQTPGKVVEITLAVGGYFVAAWVLFRVRPRVALVISGCHMVLGMALWVAVMLASWAGEVKGTP